MYDTIVSFLTNPINVVVILFVVYKFWQQSQPFPGEDELPEKVNSLDEWKVLSKSDAIVVCDFYATWCPPCKSAAPLYKVLSEDKSFVEDVVFRKCNVDKAADVARACGIQSMPTFKVYRKGVELSSISGWNESKLRQCILSARK